MMTTKTSNSPLEKKEVFDYICRLISQEVTHSEIADKVNKKFNISTSEASIRRFRERHSIKVEEHILSQDEEEGLVVDVADYEQLNDLDAILTDRGLSLDKWEVASARLSEWESQSPEGPVLQHAAKINLRRKMQAAIIPARSEGWKAPKRADIDKTKPRLVVALPDQHAPWHDKEVHKTVLAWLAHNRPEEGVLLGDLLDFGEISRHRHDPDWAATTQHCIDSGYQVLRSYVQASPDTRWQYILGNHEYRLRATLIDNIRELYNLRPGQILGEELNPALSLSHLLRLDELGIKYVSERGSYEHTKVKLSKHLGAYHGHRTGPASGSAALKALNQFGHSIIQGHTHKQSVIFQTSFDIDGNPETLVGAEIGCLCELKGGLGYAVANDWQQGFAGIHIYPDGTFHLELATYINGHLYWQGQRYKGE